MELVHFTLDGYKRFAEPCSIHLGGKLVAVVGPNEAGKTSLLHGLLHINNRSFFVRDGASQEITRNKNLEDKCVVAEFIFAVDDKDLSQLAQYALEVDRVRWFTVCKTVAGEFFYKIDDYPKRDLTLRHNLASQLKEVVDSVEIASTDGKSLSTKNSSVISILSSKNEFLSNSQIEALHEYWEIIDKSNDKIQKIAEQISELIASEKCDPKEILRKRCPEVLFFSDKDRDLLSEYDLNSFFKPKNSNPPSAPIPRALRNLVSTANLDLKELHAAQAKRDPGRIRTMLNTANLTLSQKLQDTWKQSNLSVELDLDQWRLTILIGSEKGDYVKIAERSDGLRQFVALLMFLSQKSNQETKPIVLIDEAERHLHYDAQADLIQMFTRQNVASKIIYTTHSIGCLPEDLGSVRMIAADEPHSKINNWFWTGNTPGFSTLLFALGANTMAFIPMRYAVITEGAADMILLPSLLKSAIGKDELGFQVAPGLSSVNSEGIAIVDKESPRTVYLVDSDEGGRKIYKKIISAGVAQERILALPSINAPDETTVVEDFVNRQSYVRAVNIELKRLHGEQYQVALSDIDGSNISKRVEIWCQGKGISAPSKRAVAYRLIEDRYDYPLVRSEVVQLLCELHKDLRSALGCNLANENGNHSLES